MTLPRLGKPRKLTDFESSLIRRMIELASAEHVSFCASRYFALDYVDNAPGSILLVKRNAPKEEIKFGRELVRAEFDDVDGVSVSIALNLGQDDEVFELDIWKVDDSEVLDWPSMAKVRELSVDDPTLN